MNNTDSLKCNKLLLPFLMMIAVMLPLSLKGIDLVLSDIDSIPPLIILEAQDQFIDCTDDVLQSVITWYDASAGSVGGDNQSSVLMQGVIEISEVVDILSNSQTLNCGNTGQVEVGFVAIDSCGNQSIDTTFAIFSVQDTIGPIILSPPNSSAINCTPAAEAILSAWLDTMGGAVIIDSCDSDAAFTSFTWTDTDNNSGIGNFVAPPSIPIPVDRCNWSVSVNFIAEDDCGNQSSATSVFFIIDNTPPVFEVVPADTFFNCDNVPSPFSLLATDDCSGFITATSSDSTTQSLESNSCEFFNYSLFRTYTAIDDCGNMTSFVQEILVTDTLEPRFIAPPDTIIQGAISSDPMFTGRPINVVDNCNSEVIITFTDNVVSDFCRQIITRQWEIRDVCGLSLILPQRIELIDEGIPEITVPATNINIGCDSSVLASGLFLQWVNNMGGAQAQDAIGFISQRFAAIPSSYDAGDPNTFPGTAPGGLDEATCPTGQNGVLRFESVDFVFVDECGNTVVTNAQFSIVDIENPQILNRLEDLKLVNNDDGSCESMITVEPIEAIDNCAGNPEATITNVRTKLTAPNTDDPVDPFVVRLGPFNNSFLPTEELVTLNITMTNIDANNDTEFFVIRGENGIPIGRTVLTIAQCDDVSSTLTISRDLFRQWVSDDGFLDLDFSPNLVSGVSGLSINNVCGSSFVEVGIILAPTEIFELTSFIQINADNPIEITTATEIAIPNGVNEVKYIVRDCAGNEDSYIRIVELSDEVAPLFDCPQNVSVDLPAGDCEVAVELPFDFNIFEACPDGNVIQFNVLSGDDGLLVFNQEGGEFAAQPKAVNFPVTMSGALIGDPVIRLFVFSDINEVGETFELIGENGLTIGETAVVPNGSCQTQTFDFTINRDVYLEWIIDGILSLQIQPNNTGEAINPCLASVVTQNGQTDGISTIGMRLSLSTANWDIDISGATVITPADINTNQFPITAALQSGEHTVTYTIGDLAGNNTSCSFNINVSDVTPPSIQCVDSLFGIINPSGTIPLKFAEMALMINAEDDCEIANVTISELSLNCQNIGQPEQIVITATDISGNTSSCTIEVIAQPFILEPIAEPALCLGDSIRLVANVPALDDQSVYDFSWTGPNGFVSIEENPIIPNASGAASGTYELTIAGQNTCESVGTVDVFVQDFTSPSINISSESVCAGDSLILTTVNFQSEAIYNWFEGSPDSSILLAATNQPTLRILPSSGRHSYFLLVESDFCEIEFSPSEILQVQVLNKPILTTTVDSITVCAGENIRLSAIVDDSSNVDFSWSGPNSFMSSKLLPAVLENAEGLASGTYSLIANRGNCLSDTININVQIEDNLPQPNLSPIAPLCEGDLLTLRISNYSSTELTYTWFLDNTLFTTTSLQFLIVDNSGSDASGQWAVMVNDNRCQSLLSEPIAVDIQSNLGLNIRNNGPVCATDQIQLFADTIQNATYRWTGPNNFTSNQISPQNEAVPGLYSVAITTMEGCQSEGSTSVRVVPQPTIDSIAIVASECADGVSRAELSAQVSDTGLSYMWTNPSGATFATDILELTNYSSEDNGFYKLSVSNGGCISIIDSIQFQVRDAPATPTLDLGPSICEGDSIQLTISNPSADTDSYLWKTPSGQITQTEGTFVIASTQILDGGQYSVIAMNEGCESFESDAILVEVFANPSPPTILTPLSTCFGNQLIIEVALENDTEYEWEGPNNFTSFESRIVIDNVTAQNQGVYRVKKTQNGCSSIFQITEEIIFLDIPASPLIITEDIEICAQQAESIEICIDRNSFQIGTSFTWINTTNDRVLARSSDLCLELRTFIGLVEGQNAIVVQRDQDGCISPESLPIIVNLSNTIDIEPRAQEDVIVCDVNNINITAENPPVGIGRWSSPDPNITFADATDNETVVFGLRDGINTVAWSLSNGPCTDFVEDRVNLTVELTPEAHDDIFQIAYNTEGLFDITNNDQLPVERELTILRQPEAGIVGVDNDLRVVYQADPRFLGTTSFEYELCSITCPDKCSRAVATIEVGDVNDCFAPTIITPNNDGVNDNMHIPCIETGRYRTNQLFVYNQWGDEVFSAEPYENNWAGTYNGNDLPTGTYYYIFRPSSTAEIVRGFLILER